MGCPNSVLIGKNLVFSIPTHDPDTSVLSDADALPTYRIYEDVTALPILTGTMPKLDGANTTGFYAKLIACTKANGFRHGRTYTVYIRATVDGDEGGISYAFTALTDSHSTIVASAVNDAGASPTVFLTELTEATTDHYKGRIVIFTSGALQNQATDIRGYRLVGGKGEITCTGLTEAPADGTTFVMV